MPNYFLMILFSVEHNVNTSVTELNNDLNETGKWVQQWKMSFNLDSSKQAQEVIFIRKFNKKSHSPLLFNNNVFYQANHKSI